MTVQRKSSVTRLLLAALIITFAAYWAGARYGQRQPIGVSATQRTASPAKVKSIYRFKHDQVRVEDDFDAAPDW